VITAEPTRVPDSLTELDRWIVCRYEHCDGGKPTKVPYQINGSHASSTVPKTWCSWDEALNAWQEQPERWSGIGFVFSPDDPFFGIDLDQCLDGAGKLKPWAQPIMERFSDTYAEISPSARGIKIWAKGKLLGGGAAFPPGRRPRRDLRPGTLFHRDGQALGWPDARSRGAPSRSRLAARALAPRPEEGPIYRRGQD